MSDRKGGGSWRRKKLTKRKQAVPRRLPSNEMIIESRWNYGQITSGTAGLISAADISPSIANSVEYSTLQALFNEVRCLTCTVSFGPTVTTTAGVGMLLVGTQMQANQTTHDSTPLSVTQVINLDRKKEYVIGSSQIRIHHYRMKVPRGLEFSSITADAPATVTPYAGSPGCVYIYAAALTANVVYMNIYVTTRHHLRGRN